MYKRLSDKNKIIFARKLRQNQNKDEQLLWNAIRSRRLTGLKFRRQFPIAGYVLDFYCSEKKLAVELDGESHKFRYEHDSERTRILEKQGIHVLRFSNEDIYKNLQGVLIDIEKFCK